MLQTTDEEFAEGLRIMWAMKLEARTKMDLDEPIVGPRNPRYKRRHENPGRLAALNAAEAKRLRKMAKRARHV